jgi:hypothetical protein
MRLPWLAGFLVCGLFPLHPVPAQDTEPNLMQEVAAVKAEVDRNRVALRDYSWVEHTEVLKKGDLQASTESLCRYDSSGALTKQPTGVGKEQKEASSISKRHRVRKKADMQDYVERAVGMINNYIPPKPELLLVVLEDNNASVTKLDAGRLELRFKNYFQRGDALAFTYNSSTKRLLEANIDSTLGGPKDPVTLHAVFETLPDGTNHLATATVNANAKKVQVKMRNDQYHKIVN